MKTNRDVGFDFIELDKKQVYDRVNISILYIIYFYRETMKKVDIQRHSNGTITYKRQKFWYFERDLSVGDLTDVITTINVPVVGSAEFVRGSFFMEWGISDMLATLEATIFVKKTVGELLFEGYKDDVMDLGSSMGDMEPDVKMDKFGWFYNVSTSFVKYKSGYQHQTQFYNLSVNLSTLC